MSKEKKKSTSLRLDPVVLKELKLLAVEQDTSIQAIVESLIKQYLASHMKGQKNVKNAKDKKNNRE